VTDEKKEFQGQRKVTEAFKKGIQSTSAIVDIPEPATPQPRKIAQPKKG
jgi:hypothetical protein